MQIKKELLDVMKSFANVNGNIVLEKDSNFLRSKSPSADIYAWYKMGDDQDRFPVEFPIFELNGFLSSLGLFNNPELNFTENCLTIVDENGKSNMKYYAGFRDILIGINDKDFKRLDPIVTFDLSNETLQNINKTASTMRVNDVGFIGDGENILVKIANKVYEKNDGTNTYTMKIGETDKVFEVYHNVDALKIIQTDYKYSVCSVNGHVLVMLESTNMPNEAVLYYYLMPNDVSSIKG